MLFTDEICPMNTVKAGFKYLFKQVFARPDESESANKYLVKLIWALRIFILIFGVFQLARGEILLGIWIIISVFMLVVPSFFTRSRITDIPLEIEFFLFIIVFFQFVIGEAQGLYGNLPYYDDLVHFFFPFLVSVIGFTIAYALYFSGKLKVSTGTMILLVIIVTLGIGALWEIIEYASDQFLLPHFDALHRAQGSSPSNANYDTMNDLSADLLGGIVGAIVASRYILETKYNKRLKELFREIVLHFFKERMGK